MKLEVIGIMIDRRKRCATIYARSEIRFGYVQERMSLSVNLDRYFDLDVEVGDVINVEITKEGRIKQN